MPADCDDTLYRMRLVQSTGLFYDFLIFGSPQQQVIRDTRQQFWQQFQKNTPRVVVVGSGLFPGGFGYGKLASWPLFQQELATDYSLYDDRWFPPPNRGKGPIGFMSRRTAWLPPTGTNQFAEGYGAQCLRENDSLQTSPLGTAERSPGRILGGEGRSHAGTFRPQR